jgi:2-polyprenyl-6-methoxyphenol hydroxylase-like FAD-dependent oxidoreductase
VRGEALFPWGAAELEALGLRSLLLTTCARENRWWDDFLGGEQIGHRDTITETPGRIPTLTFYHPEMQETLLGAAVEAGAEVRRGARVVELRPGAPATVKFEQDDGTQTVAARMVVGATGRSSALRRWAGFESHQDPPRLRIAGVLLEGVSNLPQDATQMVINPDLGQSAILVPQKGDRVRAYVVFPSLQNRTLSGEGQVPQFITEAVRIGVQPELFDGAKTAGPLATFEGADSWVEHPYRNGIALIGDAAAASDPSWGQGLAMAVRDVRVLCEVLLANDDWDAAGNAYAVEHDRAYATIHTTEELFTTLFLETGPQADARRAHALPLIAEEPERVPDAFMAGPDAAPVDEFSRARFFGQGYEA